MEVNSTKSDLSKQKYHFYYNHTKLPPYDYSYYDPTYNIGSPQPYPSYLNYGQDLWGYFNGKYNAHLLIPLRDEGRYKFEKTAGSYPDRSVSEVHTKASVLEKIVFPTGGSTEFEYESNRIENKIFGGLRTKTVRSFDSNGNFLEEKEYEYDKGYEINQISTSPNFSAYRQHYRYVSIPMGTGQPAVGEFFTRVIYSTNIFYSQGISSNPVFYNNVTEYFGNKFINHGKKEYKYLYFFNEVDYLPGQGSEFYRYYTTITDNFWKRGRLLEEMVYKNNNGIYELIQKATNDYRFYNEKSHITGTVVTAGIIDFESQSAHSNKYKFRWFDVRSNTGIAKLISRTTENYKDGQLQQVETTRYGYDKLLSSTNSHQQLTRKTLSLSTGDSIMTKYIYPLDYQYQVQSGTDYLVNKSMRDANIVNMPIEILSYSKKGNILKTLEGYFYKYKGINQLQEKLRLKANLATSYNGSSYINANGYNLSDKYETEISYDYDLKNNIRQFIKRDGMPVSILWSYNYQYPIAEIKNMYYSDLARVVDTENIAKSQNPNISGIKNSLQDLPDIFTTFYSLKPNVGILNTINPRGVSTSFSYDGFNRLEKIKDHNSSLLSEYSYKYEETNSNTLVCSFTTSPQYVQYTKPVFSINIYNGTGSYTYNWVLKDAVTNAVLANSTSDTFAHYRLLKTGKMSMSCTISDSNGNSKTFSRIFEIVKPAPLSSNGILPDDFVFDFGERLSFSNNIAGGSEEYTYRWTLKNKQSGNVINTGNSRSIYLELQQAGGFELTCIVKDINTKEEITTVKDFEVKTEEASPWRLEFSEVDEIPSIDSSEKLFQTYLYCEEDTDVKLNLWINGRFDNEQFALFQIGSRQFNRHNKCKIEDDGSQKCLNSPETVNLKKGFNLIKISLYNLNNNVTRAGISILSTSKGKIGYNPHIDVESN